MVFSLKSGDQGYDEDEGGQVTDSIESRGTESVGYSEEHGGEWVLWVGMNQDSGPNRGSKTHISVMEMLSHSSR